MFSIIVPVYNKEFFLGDCLNSIKNQNFTYFEIILVNDGSTDSSLKIMKDFKDENPLLDILIIDQKNQGVSAARNNGIKNSKYDFLCFLDADDFWIENHLYEISLLISDFSEASIFSSSFIVRKKNNTTINKICDIERGYVTNFFESSLKNDVVISSNVCVRKKCFIDVSFPVGVTLTEDLYVWVTFALKFKFAYNNSVTVVVNQFDDNSRAKRYEQLPYVVLSYFQNDDFYVKKFISYVSLAHLYVYKSNNNIYNYLKFSLFIFKFNKKLFLISFFILFIPMFILNFLKKFKSLFLS